MLRSAKNEQTIKILERLKMPPPAGTPEPQEPIDLLGGMTSEPSMEMEEPVPGKPGMPPRKKKKPAAPVPEV